MHNSNAHLNLQIEKSFETDLYGVLADPQDTGFQWDEYNEAMTEYDDSVPQSIPQHELTSILGRTFNV